MFRNHKNSLCVIKARRNKRKSFIAVFVMLLSIAFLLFLGGCNTSPKKDDKAYITMTVTKQNVRLAIIGHGEMVVEWGDGNKAYESMSHSRDELQWTVFEYTYQQNRDHDIKVYGQVTHLDCSENGLTSLDVTKGHLLQEIDIKTNLLTAEVLDKLFLSLHDATHGKQDNIVHIGDNPGTYECDRDIAMKKDWMILCCGDGKLPNITMTTVNQNVSLSLKGMGEIFICWGDGNVIETTLIYYVENIFNNSYEKERPHNISLFAGISTLDCTDNGLTYLNVDNATSLGVLYAGFNLLTSIDTSNNRYLDILRLNNNLLTSIDISNNAVLAILDIDHNFLSHLDVIHNTRLFSLRIRNNEFTTNELNNLFLALHYFYVVSQSLDKAIFTNVDSADSIIPPQDKIVYIGGNHGTEDCDRSIARAKGWSVVN